jgi:hypothetical protein
VALFLVALVLTTFSFSSGMFSQHQKLVETLDNFERAVRFSQDESVLRNRIVRLLIRFDGENQNFSVEYGPDADFVLPAQFLMKSEEAELLDEKELAKKKDQINKAFSKVEEFLEEPEEINDLVRIIGVGSSLTNTLQLNDGANLFAYPSGEKDAALIIVATDEEIATLEVEPFTMDFKRNFYRIEGETGDLLDFQIQKAKSLYEEWLK